MIATIVSTAVASVTTSIARLRRNNMLEKISVKRKKGGEPGGSPLSLFYCVDSEAR